MTFSAEVKLYLTQIKEKRPCCRQALLYGLLATSKAQANGVVFVTPHKDIAELCAELTETQTAARAVVVPYSSSYETHITSTQDAFYLYESIPLYPSDTLDNKLFVCTQCIKAFFRGLFLASGSVTAPEKGYHLELSNIGNRTSSIIDLAAEQGIVLKPVTRGATTALYMKDSTGIEDFLAFIGAAKASLDFMNAKISKEVRSDLNRLINCETSNIDKAATASAAQLEAIRYLADNNLLETLPYELRETAKIRLEYPEMSLRDLKNKFDPPLSKSGLYHRLKKLTEAVK